MDTEIQSQQFSPFVLIIILVFCLAAYAIGFHPSSIPHQTSQPVSTQGHSIYGSPSVSADFIERVLAHYHSPAKGYGVILYTLSVQYGIDPVYPLAFFEHESNLGTKGEASYTHSLGNLRCISGYACVDEDRGGYAYFNSWAEGFQEWFNLLTSSLYKGDGLTTVETIIPRYAPSADNNDESAYINSLLYCVNTWHTGQIAL
jgi:hypothetical protein